METAPKRRNLKEQIIDKILLLYILNKYRFSGKTKLHKAIFFANKSAIEKKMKIFNFNFIRYSFGEYSNELQSDYKNLVDKEFLIDGTPIEVSPQGKELLKRCEGIINRNRSLLKIVEPIIEHTASRPLEKVKEMAYTKVIISGRRVEDIEIGTPLLSKLEEHESEIKIFIDDKWVEKLNIILTFGLIILDEEIRREYKKIHEIMLSKRVRLLNKLDEYEKVS